MLIPAPRLIAACAGLLGAGIAVAVWPALAPAAGLAAALAALAAAVDGLRAAREAPPRPRRSVSASLAVGVRQRVRIELDNPLRRRLRLQVHDHHPDTVEAAGLPARIEVPPGAGAALEYPIRPQERGEHAFGPVELRTASPFGLWERRSRSAAADTIRVYPNFDAARRYALFATDHRLSQLGVLQRRRRGEGLEFHQLRDYRPGDALRQIDWKATSRLRRPVSREYQDERNQQIVFVLDRGRRMAARDDALSHFDHSLNAALLLAWVGLRQGDAVGLMTMGDPAPARWIAPRKSISAFNLILNAVFDLQPSLGATDYRRAAVELLGRLPKRALVVILTNLRDEDCGDLLPAIALLRRRHLVVLASLRERAVFGALKAPVRQVDDAILHAAAADYLLARTDAFRRLAHAGAECLDCEPAELPLRLVNRYLEIKRSGAL